MPPLPTTSPAGGTFDAIVVLGCAVVLDPSGRPSRGALARRLEAAALAFARRGGEQTVVVASGGRRWRGLVEADVMARELERLGVPPRAIVRERSSLTTRDNARFAAEVLARRGLVRAAIVTSSWHLPRAVALFRRTGLLVEGVAAAEHDTGYATRLWRHGRERLLMWVQLR